MAKLVWDAVNERTYEVGVDRGVIKVEDKDVIPWNGLLSVSEVEIGDTMLRSQFDGMTFANLKFGGAFQGAVQTLSFPDYVDECVGFNVVYPGLTLTAQPRVPFHLSYRSMIGTVSYKIHFIYNVMVAQKKRTATSIGNKTDPEQYEFLIDAIPFPSTIFRPTAHMVVDTTKASPTDVTALENMLYGTVDDEPQFPAPEDLITIFG